ncbi:MAG: hypothetical protein AAGE84_02750, partial [Cyanobacteria bacterium P01_G01_bin.39]
MQNKTLNLLSFIGTVLLTIFILLLLYYIHYPERVLQVVPNDFHRIVFFLLFFILISYIFFNINVQRNEDTTRRQTSASQF